MDSGDRCFRKRRSDNVTHPDKPKNKTRNTEEEEERDLYFRYCSMRRMMDEVEAEADV